MSGNLCKVLLEKFKDLPILMSLMASENPTIRKTALSLLDNMSRSRVQVDMGKNQLDSQNKLKTGLVFTNIQFL